MKYGQELKDHWRYWVAAALGLSVGAGIQSYTSSLFGPPMTAEFGWSRSQYALHGVFSMAMVLAIPFVGRLTDLMGSKKIAAFGIVALPLAYVAMSFQNGDVRVFYLLSFLGVLVSSATTPLVYSRVVVMRFLDARGIALALCASAPALLMAGGVPALGWIIEHHGWRAAYRAMAVASLMIGGVAVLMLPKHDQPLAEREGKERGASGRRMRDDYPLILSSPTFWIILGGMALCNVSTAAVGSQFGLLLIEQKMTPTFVPVAMSVYAVGVVFGRFICGVALDRLPTHLVAATGMFLPAIGLLLLGGQFGDPRIILFAAAVIGLSQGAEADLMQYLVAEYFPASIFASVSGLLMASLAISITVGAMTLTGVLHLTDSYIPFLIGTGILTVIGSMLFMLLGRAGSQLPKANARAA